MDEYNYDYGSYDYGYDPSSYDYGYDPGMYTYTPPVVDTRSVYSGGNDNTAYNAWNQPYDPSQNDYYDQNPTPVAPSAPSGDNGYYNQTYDPNQNDYYGSNPTPPSPTPPANNDYGYYNQGQTMGPAAPPGSTVRNGATQTPAGYGNQGGFDWNHPIDSLGKATGLWDSTGTNAPAGGSTGRSILGSVLGGGTGGGSSGGSGSNGIFDWLGNNLGGLAAGALGLYAANKLVNSGSNANSVTPQAGYGGAGGALPIAPGTALVNPGTNPGYAIGQNGIKGL